jgi:YHS domain-containing protein
MATGKIRLHRRPRMQPGLEGQHGKFMYDFEDVTYYFCSELCRDEFIREPKKFAGKKGS